MLTLGRWQHLPKGAQAHLSVAMCKTFCQERMTNGYNDYAGEQQQSRRQTGPALENTA